MRKLPPPSFLKSIKQRRPEKLYLPKLGKQGFILIKSLSDSNAHSNSSTITHYFILKKWYLLASLCTLSPRRKIMKTELSLEDYLVSVKIRIRSPINTFHE